MEEKEGWCNVRLPPNSTLKNFMRLKNVSPFVELVASPLLLFLEPIQLSTVEINFLDRFEGMVE